MYVIIYAFSLYHSATIGLLATVIVYVKVESRRRLYNDQYDSDIVRRVAKAWDIRESIN